MNRPLLSNEERLRRLRVRWAKQAAERRKERAECNACPPQTCGGGEERSERLISPHTMRIAEAHFWGKRGINLQREFNDLPPSVRALSASN